MEGQEIQILEKFIHKEKILTDPPSLTAYSIDASIYKFVPKAVVLAESEADIFNLIQFSNQTGIPITARSGGTNLTGNAIGNGIILECSRLNKILEINPVEKWARVQPGMVYSEFNHILSQKGVMFAPDPSSGDMCKIGGMIGNNAAGPHSLKYGATKDNVLELDVLLANGKRITAKPYLLNSPPYHALLEQHPQMKKMENLVKNNADLIKSKKRLVSKNSSGYNLFSLAEGFEKGIFDLPRLFIGSEGTLGITLEAKVKLVPKPPFVLTALIYFKSLQDIGKAVNHLLPLQPSALEMMDGNAMDMVGRRPFLIPDDAQALLLVEFDHENREEQMQRAKSICEDFHLCASFNLAREKEKQEALWKVRKAIYPTLYRYDKQKKPINFVDDVVVSANKLPELIHYLDRYFKDRNVPVAIYGHIGNGNAHINPLLNVNQKEDFEKMIAISKDVHRTVIQNFQGSICGEHGDGRVRAEFVKALYGDELFRLFQETKKIFDPDQILNPGVKISENPFTENIDFSRLSKQCATCGKCNAVCPVYDIEQEESNSARGWFHILTDQSYTYQNAGRVVESCLNCKSCREVCPAGLDVSELVLEKREENPNRLTALLAALQSKPVLFGRLLKLAGWTQPYWDHPPSRWLIEKMSGLLMKPLSSSAKIPRKMILPKLARHTLRERFEHLTEEKGYQNKIAYFHGCAANYFNDGVGESLLGVLNYHGIQPVLPVQRCSGTPIQTYGHKKQFLEAAAFNLHSLARFDAVITGCASCTLMLKDYPNFFTDSPDAETARILSKRVTHITQFLTYEVQLKPFPVQKTDTGPMVTYHSSCHLRVAGVSKEPRDLIRKIPGNRFVEMPGANRCAGGAGTYIVKNYDLSKEIFERKKRGIQECGAETVATSCPACMIQLNDGLKGKVSVKHVVQLLAEAYQINLTKKPGK